MISLPEYELSMLQRMLLIWLWIVCGLILGTQASQHYADQPSRKWYLTKESKPYWYTFYVFFAFLLVQITYNVLMWRLEGILGGFEATLLDSLWMGLLGLECLMVVGVLLRAAFRAVQPGPKLKAQ